MDLPATARLLGATLRLTRLVISDDLGVHLIQQPMDSLVSRHTETEDLRTAAGTKIGTEPRYPDWIWLRDGLTCPACIGFWIALGVLALEVSPVGERTSWRLVTGALALNEVALHAGARLGDYE